MQARRAPCASCNDASGVLVLVFYVDNAGKKKGWNNNTSSVSSCGGRKGNHQNNTQLVKEVIINATRWSKS